MSLVDGLLVGAIVLAAALYLGRRVVRTLARGSCGCGVAGRNGCPAARSLADTLERAARQADARG